MNHPDLKLIQYLSTILWTGLILGYGAYQFMRREKKHRSLMRSLMEGDEPQVVQIAGDPVPALWRILTTASIELILLASLVGLIVIRPRILYGGDVVYIIAFFFLIVFVFLLVILMRDIRTHRSQR